MTHRSNDSHSSSPPSAPSEAHSPHRLAAVPISQVTIDDSFWSPKRKVWREVTFDDCFNKFDPNGRGAARNFDLARDGQTGEHTGPPWYDGLMYEMICGAADFLAEEREPSLEARIDGLIERIVAAQNRDPDGYLNTWTQSMAPQTHRWGMNGGDDRWQHDVYNAGMMIEAGAHYYRATGKATLLKAATRMADLMCATIGPPPKANVVPGHSGPEEALVQLYLLFHDSPEARRDAPINGNERRYLELAEFFIDARGRFEGRTGKDESFGEYGQDHAPLERQTSLEGHAVRAALFCAGIAAAARVNDRAEYRAASLRFWDSLARRKIYITGAAGAVEDDEKLGPDYFLPNDGYLETCAAVGVGIFSHAMNLLFGEARTIDELERALYNAALGGVSLTGDRYFYQNPLEGEGLRRWEWHGCPCCPPMFLKLMGALPGYLYAQEPGGVYVNLFVGSRANLTVDEVPVRIEQATRFPWDGEVRIALEPERPTEFDLFIRIPAWSEGPVSPDDLYQPVGLPAERAVEIEINGQPVQTPDRVRGYVWLRRKWEAGDAVEFRLDMAARQVMAHPSVRADRGLVALTRGPVVYCVESVDVPGGLRNLAVPPDAAFEAQFRPDELGGVTVLRGQVHACAREADRKRIVPTEITAVPFYASANREPSAMRVWLPSEATELES